MLALLSVRQLRLALPLSWGSPGPLLPPPLGWAATPGKRRLPLVAAALVLASLAARLLGMVHLGAGPVWLLVLAALAAQVAQALVHLALHPWRLALQMLPALVLRGVVPLPAALAARHRALGHLLQQELAKPPHLPLVLVVAAAEGLAAQPNPLVPRLLLQAISLGFAVVAHLLGQEGLGLSQGAHHQVGRSVL